MNKQCALWLLNVPYLEQPSVGQEADGKISHPQDVVTIGMWTEVKGATSKTGP